MHFVTVGTTQIMMENLWDRIAAKGGLRFSHIVHPMLVQGCWEKGPAPGNVHFFCNDYAPRMPSPDRDLLASLERDEVPTVHNMILSDRVVSKLNYLDALAYATFLTRRLISLYETVKPSAVIGA